MNQKKDNLLKLWMPVSKTANGKLVGILSDSSIDRDEEFMDKKLLQSWADNNKTLKALANHENKMEKWVGGWKNLKVIKKGKNSALIAEPWFFDSEANPLASQIEKQVHQALEHGENAGISIGAIPYETVEKEINGETHVGYSNAEIVEATWVPIQSNRNATFGHMAKMFDLKMEEDDVKMGKTYTQKEYDDALSKVQKDAEDEIAQANKVAEEKVAEAEAKVVDAEAKAEEAEKKAEESEAKVAEAEAKAEEAEKKLATFKEKNAPNNDEPTGTENTNKKVPEPTLKNMLRLRYK